MKNTTIILLFFTFLFSACQQAESNKQEQPKTETATSIDLNRFPVALQKIFTKHGTIERWDKMHALSYEIEKEEGNEKQFVDLKNRRERIETSSYKTGFDGENFWLEADTTYKGNPVFYHNLMFYFYAMPFVVADPGIHYDEVPPVEYEGKSYPGIRISYDDGVGISPKDEYFIHYNPETYEMAWLGYTVTYYSKEKSNKLGWIRYDDWKDFNGLRLPNSATWFKTTEEGKLDVPRRTRKFVNVMLQEQPFKDGVFAKTEKAEIVEN